MSDSLAKVAPAVRGMLESEVERALSFAAASRAPSTRRAYQSDFLSFHAWCIARGVAALPTTAPIVAVYAADMAHVGNKVSTIKRALVGIAWAQRKAGHHWPKGDPVISEVMGGIARERGTAPSKKAPVLGVDLASMIGTLGVDLRGLRDRALITLGWAGAFRRSELVALRVDDVRRVKDGYLATVCRSKTDQTGEGKQKGIPYAGNPALCPVRSLEAWLSASGITTGPLFRAIDRHGNISEDALCDRSVARIVQRMGGNAGLEARNLGGHSLRSGLATEAAARGKPIDSIMRQTLHNSVQIALGYVRPATLFQNNAFAGLL